MLILFKPRVFAERSYVSGCLSKLDLIGDFQTAKNLIRYA